MQVVDSLILEKLDVVIETVNRKTMLPVFTSLIAAIVGGTLVLLGQYFDRRSKQKAELKKDVLESFSKSESILLNIKSTLRNLAFFRSQVSYWHYVHKKEIEEINKEIEEDNMLQEKNPASSQASNSSGSFNHANEYMNRTMKSSDEAIKANIELGKLLSEYYGVVSKVNILLSLNKDLAVVAEFLKSQKLKDVIEYDSGFTQHQVNALYVSNAESTYTEYLLGLSEIETLQDQLRVSVKEFSNGN